MDTVITIPLGVALAAATATDLRSQRIPNLITFSLAILALAYHGLTGGYDGFLFGLGGLFAGFMLLVVPYAFGVMGAGDVKFMAACGAALGPEGIFWAFLFTSVLGGLYGLLVMHARRDVLRDIFLELWATMLFAVASRSVTGAPPRKRIGLPRLCYGVAIASGVAAYLALRFFEVPGPWA